MSSEKKTKSNKRKIAIRYIILAACILVIAAVTVTVVFAANDWFRNDITIDNGDTPLPPVKDPDENDPDKPTSGDTTFLAPVNDLNVSTVFEFFKNESLNNKWYFHTGLDLTASAGTAVVASLDGTVESVVRDEKMGETTVTISHEKGIKTVYTYIDPVEGLKKGDKVKRGDKIGTVAEACGSEYKMGPHLHFEVIENGEPKDPADFLEITEK